MTRSDLFAMSTENLIPKPAKVVFYIFGYLALLLPSLIFALQKWWDIADPPTSEIPYSFWVTAWGQFLYFGFAFVAPAVVLIIFSFALRWRGSHVA